MTNDRGLHFWCDTGVELDLIVNYDIKYCLGRDTGDGEEE